MSKNPTRLALILVICSVNLISCATKPINRDGPWLAKDPWFASDKAAHFALSSAIAAGVASAAKAQDKSDCDAALLGFSISLAIGAGKESYDKRSKGTLYSFRDMVWNSAGATLGSLLASGCH